MHVWMAENLKLNVKGSEYYEGSLDNLKRYGKLYSWTVAQEVCPAGWHLPSIKEWHSLINGYGKIYDENGNIPYKELNKEQRKEISQRYKEAFLFFQEDGASGFNVLYGGYFYDYKYMGLGTVAGFWSSDDNVNKGAFKSVKAYSFQFSKYMKHFGEVSTLKSGKYSVRCVKNQ